ncbi:MAG: orotidine 5'-phosphate decarboxylase, partial [Pontimonas sp.]
MMTSHSPADQVTLCVGLDPQPAVLEAWGLPDSELGLESFVRAIVPVLESSGCKVAKPQVAFFERFGVAGMRQLAVLLGELRTRGIFT